MPFGIPEESFNQMVSVFSAFHHITRVRLFGSRALGRQRPGSDIDLALEGVDITLSDLLELRAKLDSLILPYRFDVVILDNQTNAALRDHVERVGIEIYRYKT